MKKLLLSLVGVLCSFGATWASTVADLSAITTNFEFTPTAALADGTLYSGNKLLSIGGSGYSEKGNVTVEGVEYTPCLQIKNSRQIAIKVACNATITVIGSSHSSRSWRIGSTSAGNEIADGGNNSTVASGNVAGTAVTPVVVYINASADLYLAKLIVSAEVDASKVSTPSIEGVLGMNYNDPTVVTITCSTDDASIYYTTDGVEPTTSSTQYTAPFSVTTACTVKAIAVKSGLTNSDVATAAVTINDQRKVKFDFSAVTLTKGDAIANTTCGNNASYKLPDGRMYYIEGKTQTGWNDGTKDYALGATVTIDKDYTFTPVFVDNTKSLGDATAIVNWTFAENEGAPSASVEGKIGYYATQTTINGEKLDVVLKINAEKNADGKGEDHKGKWYTKGRGTNAQVNLGTVFTIPAVKGMTVTYTATNGTPLTSYVTFAGNEGTVNGKVISYTYNGEESAIDIIAAESNLYPSGIVVNYPIQTITTSVSSIGYATFYSNQERVIPAGVNAYTGKLVGSVLTLTATPSDVIPAETAVVIQAENGDYDFAVGTTGAAPIENNDLKGVVVETATSSVEGGTVCVLGYENDEAGFYKYTGENLAAYKAYLVVPASEADAVRIEFTEGSSNSIENVSSAKKQQMTKKVLKDGQIVIKTASDNYNASGVQMK